MSVEKTPHVLSIRTTAGSVGRFVRHFGEMLLAMFIGMAVFGALFGALLVAVGTSSDEVLETAPALVAVVLMFNMTVPMVLWMRHQGHARARIVEMVGAMGAVAAVTVVLLWASVVESLAVCGVECALMLPAMAAVMLMHRDEYA
jgi:hypothetical protein